MSKKIPQDIITVIFSKQPVKSLLRFRCVSKTCCSLIDSQDFIKLHLNQSIATKSNFGLILKGLFGIYTLDIDALKTPVKLNHPLNIDGATGTEVIGSCNGLIALHNSERVLALYNPSTKKLKKLPVCDVKPPSDSSVFGFNVFGFGYDHIYDDYKLVRMVQFREEDVFVDIGCSFDYEVRVYSLKTDSWRRVSNLPAYLTDLYQFFYHLMLSKGYGVLAGGALHWVSLKRNNELDMLVAFDLAAEEFRHFSLPDYVNKNHTSDDEGVHVDVGSLDGYLCVFRNNGVNVDLWMMKEYGFKESWTKLFSVKSCRIASCLAQSRPLAYSKAGDKVLMEVSGEKLIWFDLVKKRLRTVKFDGSVMDSFDAETYVESLVRVSDGAGGIHGMKQRQQEEKKRRNKKKRDGFLSTGFKLVL